MMAFPGHRDPQLNNPRSAREFNVSSRLFADEEGNWAPALCHVCPGVTVLLSLVAGIPLVIKALFIAFAFITLQSRERAGDESLLQGIICSLCSFCTEFHGVWNVEPNPSSLLSSYSCEYL